MSRHRAVDGIKMTQPFGNHPARPTSAETLQPILDRLEDILIDNRCQPGQHRVIEKRIQIHGRIVVVH